MTLRLLKKELTALTELAERSDWETPEQFVTAMAAELDRQRADRKTYSVVVRHGSGASTYYAAFGPYPTKLQAEKGVAKLLSTIHMTAYAVVVTSTPEAFDRLLVDIDATPELKGDWALVREDAKLRRFKR